MKINQCSGVMLMFAVLVISGIFWAQNALSQRTVAAKLTLAQIEQLVSSKVPDSTLSTQIQRRGLAFTPNQAIVESLSTKGAGPQTLAAVEARFGKTPQSPVTAHAAVSRGNAVKLHAERGEPIHSCTVIGKQDYSNQVTSEASSWIQLNRGEKRNNYSFAYDGSLFYSGKMLTNNIPVTGTGDNHWIYAQSIALSPKSPSGRSSILQACEEPNLGGLCWALYVVDYTSLHIEQTVAGKYGSDRRVTWIRGDDEYAVLRDTDEGQTNYYRIHLPTGESTECNAVRSVASSLDVVPSTQDVESSRESTAVPLDFQSSQPAAARPVPIHADNGIVRLSVRECRVSAGKVICIGEETYIGQGTSRRYFVKNTGSMIDDHGGNFRRFDAWVGEPTGPHNYQVELPSGIPVNCVWEYEGFTPGSKTISLIFPSGIVLRDVPLTYPSQGIDTAGYVVLPATGTVPNPDWEATPSLAETMQFIQDTLKEQSQLEYVSESIRSKMGVTSHSNTSGAYYEVVADPKTCTLHMSSKYDIRWAVLSGDKTVSSEDDHSEFVSTVSIKDVETIKVVSMQDFQNRRNVDLGHPEITYIMTPPVFLILLSASKPVFSIHASTTKGNQTPEVNDEATKESQFLLRDEDTANRIAKAIRKAAELCGADLKDAF